MEQLHLELRPFHLSLSLESLHGNAEQPAAYTAALVVCDHTLPSKGVSYRMPRSGGSKDLESPPKIAKENVNVLLGSKHLKEKMRGCSVSNFLIFVCV